MTMTTSIVAELHDGPAHRHRQDGSMWYIPPRTGQRLISVTSVFDFIAKEQLDKRWRPGLSAQAAFDELPRVVAASRVKPCGRTNNECDHDFQDRCAACPCGDCKACMIRWLTYRHYAETKKARDRGSAMHHWIENWVKFDGKVSRPDPGEECAPYVASFLRFVEDMGLTPDSWELLETTVLNYTDGWGKRFYTKSGFLPALSDDVIEACAALSETIPPDAELSLWAHSGAVGRVPDDAMAYTGRDAAYSISAELQWTNAADDDARIAWGRAAMAALKPHLGTGRYVNDVVEAGTDGAQIYGQAKYERLVALKRKYDPDNFFRLNQNIEP